MPRTARARYKGLACRRLWPTSCQLRLRPKNQRRKTATSSKMMNLRYLRKARTGSQKKSPACIIYQGSLSVSVDNLKRYLIRGGKANVGLNSAAAAEFPELLDLG